MNKPEVKPWALWCGYGAHDFLEHMKDYHCKTWDEPTKVLTRRCDYMAVFQKIQFVEIVEASDEK